MVISLSLLYALYCPQDPAQVYLFYRNEYMGAQQAAGTVVLKITVSFTNTSSKTGTLTATKVTAENCTIADVAAVNWGAKDAANDTAEIVATVNYECQADTDLTATYNVKFEAKANA